MTREKGTRHLSRAPIFPLLDHGVFVGAVFLLNIFVMRSSSVELFGLYTIYYSVFVFVVMVHNALMLEPFTVFVMANFKDKREQYVSAMLKFHLRMWKVTLAATCSFVIAAILATSLLEATSLLKWAVVPLGVLGVLIWKLCRVSLYAENREYYAALAAAAFASLTSSGAAILYFTDQITALNIILLILTAYIAPLLIGLYSQQKSSGDPRLLKLDRAYWGDHAGYAAWVTGSALVIPFAYNGYFWVLYYFSLLEIAAEIKAVVQLLGIFQQLLAAFFLVAFREISNDVVNRRFTYLRAKLIRFFLFGSSALLVIYLPLIIYGDYLITLLYGATYSHISAVFPIYFFLTLLQLISYLLNITLKALMQPKQVFFGYVAAALLSLSVGYYLAVNLGLHGAILGMLIAEAGLLLVLFYFTANAIRSGVINSSGS